MDHFPSAAASILWLSPGVIHSIQFFALVAESNTGAAGAGSATGASATFDASCFSPALLQEYNVAHASAKKISDFFITFFCHSKLDDLFLKSNSEEMVNKKTPGANAPGALHFISVL